MLEGEMNIECLVGFVDVAPCLSPAAVVFAFFKKVI